jgi:hypothetical protein
VPIESLAYDDEVDVVPIESLAPAESAPSGLEASFTTYSRLLRERGTVEPSVDGLLGSRLRTGPAEPAVAIETLCYRGPAALARAAAVRSELAEALERGSDLTAIRPLLQELLDLVPLALADA